MKTRLSLPAALAAVALSLGWAQAARANKIVRVLEDGQVAFGSFVRNKTPEEAREHAKSELIDFVFYDMERGELDFAALEAFIAALREPDDPHAILVRIPPLHTDPAATRERIRRVVEAGADGVTLPHVLDPEEARQAVAWVREATDELWPQNPDGDFLAFLMIEDPDAVGMAREIVSTDGLSIASPGPGSLRQAYEGDMTLVEAAVETVLAACKSEGVPCANTASEEDVVSKVERGFRLLITEGRALVLGRKAAGR